MSSERPSVYGLPADRQRPTGRPRRISFHIINLDLQQHNLGLSLACHRAQNPSRWRQLAVFNPFNSTQLFQIAAVQRVQRHTSLTHHFYRASICEGGLGNRNSVCLSVRLSVCLSHACILTKLNNALHIFYTTRKGNHSVTLIPRVVGRRCPLPSEICVQSDPPPSKNADFDRFPLIMSQL